MIEGEGLLNHREERENKKQKKNVGISEMLD
jgi:hypothetical protein